MNIIVILVLIAAKKAYVCGFEHLNRPRTIKQYESERFRSLLTSLVGTAAFVSIPYQKVQADKGAIKPSSLGEAQGAARKIKSCLDGLNEIIEAAKAKNYNKAAALLGSEPYSGFESAATIVVRSDELSPDDKVALGTIKRYGVVADVIIMLGGAIAELRSGGYKVGEVAPGNGIAESDDDDDNEPGSVNDEELQKSLRLARDSLGDVVRLISPILNK